jgi:sugar lactone lactonase YvrE
MAIDEPRQVLWLASTAGPEMRGYQPADSGRTALLRCHLPTGMLTRFEPPVDGQQHALGDVVVDRAGTVYVSDSRTPTLYRLRPGARQLDSWLRLPGGYSPQGMALSADQRTLYVADYGAGLFRIDLRRGQASVVHAPVGVSLQGIDGLCRVGKALIAIQNGMGHNQVIALRLDASGQSIEQIKILENRAAVLPEPTLGTRVGSWFYFVANSPWSRYSSAGSPHRWHRLAPLYIRRIRL